MGAVRRPRRIRLVEASLGERIGRAACDVQQIQMRAARVEITDFIFLEVVAVDHDGRRCLVLVCRVMPWQRVVEHHERELHAIRRPVVVEHVALEVGELARVAAPPVEQPERIRAVFLAATRQEGERRAVGAEGGRMLAVARMGHLHGLAAIPARHPDMREPLVPRYIGGADGIGDPLAVGRERGVEHGTQLVEVIDRKGTPRGVRGECPACNPCLNERENQNGSETLQWQPLNERRLQARPASRQLAILGMVARQRQWQAVQTN